MLWRRRKANALSQLIRSHSKKHVSEAGYPFELDDSRRLVVSFLDKDGVVSPQQVTEVPVKQILPWLLTFPRIINFDVSNFLAAVIALAHLHIIP